jgi:G3E family GTPase
LEPGSTLVPGASNAFTLALPEGGTKTFSFEVPSTGRYGLYTQHLPSEFALRLRREHEPIEPLASHEFAAGHTHDEEVSSVGIHVEGVVDSDKLDAWVGALLREKGVDIFRMKGILNVAGSDNRYVFQGVHMLFDGREDRPWGSAPRANDLVFIGRNLDRSELVRGFERCLA